jgi:myo-inositol 2-dehydrogenase/D-chiro-inositol 1-dehydrogenase
MKNVVVGVIGAGRIGRLHAENLKFRIKGVRLKTIADAFLNQGIIDWAKEIGVENVTADAADIFNDPEIDAVLICSSTSTHAE